MPEQEPAHIELEEFVRETLRQIELGATGHGFSEPIQFKVLLSETKKINGQVKVWVASGQGDHSTERVHEISFKVYPRVDRRPGPASGPSAPVY